MSSSSTDHFECPHCGEPVPVSARMCRSCGADADCGWDDSGVGEQPEGSFDDDFDYDAFVAREFPDAASDAGKRGGPGLWTSVILLLIVVSLLLSILV